MVRWNLNVQVQLQRCQSLKELKQIHCTAIKRGLHRFQPSVCKILNAYCRLGEIAEARKIFYRIEDPDLISWTSLLSGYLLVEKNDEAISIFSEFILLGFKPDRFMLVGAITAFGRKNDLKHGKMTHGMAFRYESGFDSFVDNALIDMYSRNGNIESAKKIFRILEAKDTVSWNTMLHGCIRCGDLRLAQKIFDEMPQRNIISWTGLLTGYVGRGKPIEALEIFQKMKSDGDMLTEITIGAILSACADVGALDLGRSIHGYLIKNNGQSFLAVPNCLIDMYSKSGNLESAAKIFKEMSYRDVYSWTTMISALAIHGHGFKAIQVFLEMLSVGVSPNDITFLAVLSACSHGGLIDEGRRWFKYMHELYKIKPKIKHYGCMIDLLGRAGLFEEAKSLIKEMEIKPDATIWKSLLSSCLVHGNEELAEIAAENIISLEPDDDGVYILLWSKHAYSNKWKEAMAVRKMMKDRKIKKKPGCSWIEVNGVVHEFLVDDKIHIFEKEIYLILQQLSKHLRSD